VTPQQRIAKLEGLLSRVKARASGPRPVRVVSAAVPASVVAEDAQGPNSVAAQAETALATVPPDSVAQSARAAEARLAQDGEAAAPEIAIEEVEVEVLAEPVIERAGPEPTQAKSYESRERLVAAQPAAVPEAPPALLELDEPAPPVTARASRPELLAANEPVAAEPAAGEHAEESAIEEAAAQPPSSSRRPLAPEPEEHIADIAFGASEESAPPLHTPPPESGRLPAAPIVEFDPDVTGVREAASLAHEAPPPALAGVPSNGDRATALHKEPALNEQTREAVSASQPMRGEPVAKATLEPEVTRAQLGQSGAVAQIIGEAQRYKPATMADFFDATLGL
jgi:hypothetical protein